MMKLLRHNFIFLVLLGTGVFLLMHNHIIAGGFAFGLSFFAAKTYE